MSRDLSGISDEAINIFSWTINGVVCQLINIFGIVSNIINIICFAKQGFQESINVSLTGLAVSDIGCLVTLLVTNVCFTPAVTAADFSFDPLGMNYLFIFTPHLTFSRMTAWITAIITLERCLCVIAPLKIRNIFTPGRTAVLIASLFVVFFFSIAPVYVVTKLGMTFSLLRNKTMYGLVYTKDRYIVEMITFGINNFFLPFVSFIMIVVCTMALVIKLKSSSKWREETANNSQLEIVSTRNQKVSGMVVMISSLFITCSIPVSIGMLLAATLPEISFKGKYMNAGIIIGDIGITMEAINSSMNIFIYYHMSSKYRVVFRHLFGT